MFAEALGAFITITERNMKKANKKIQIIIY